MPFSEPVRPKKLFIHIANQIMEAIQQEKFLLGDMLPSERELATIFNVSRPIIREAIASLQLIGVVETKPGLGTFVIRKNPDNKKHQLHDLNNEESPLHILEARLIIEPSVARLAAERLTTRNKERLQNLLKEMEASIDDLSQYRKLDLQFHLEIAQASENPVIYQLIEQTIRFANQNVARLIQEGTHIRGRAISLQYLTHHREIFKALISGDGEKAAESMKQHLTSAYQNWFAGEQEG